MTPEIFINRLCGVETMEECDAFFLEATPFFHEFLPEFLENIGVTQNKYHIHPVDTHIKHVVIRVPQEPRIRLAALLHDVAKARCRTEENGQAVHFYEHEKHGAIIAEEFCNRINLKEEDKHLIVGLVRHHMRPIQLSRENIKATVKKTRGFIEEFIQLKRADTLAGHVKVEDELVVMEKFFEMLREQAAKPEVIKPARVANITGDEVMQVLEIKPGKEVGEALHRVEEEVKEGRIENTKEAIVAFLMMNK